MCALNIESRFVLTVKSIYNTLSYHEALHLSHIHTQLFVCNESPIAPPPPSPPLFHLSLFLYLPLHSIFSTIPGSCGWYRFHVIQLHENAFATLNGICVRGVGEYFTNFTFHAYLSSKLKTQITRKAE